MPTMPKKYTRVHGDDQLSMREREILRSNFVGDGGCAAPDSRETMAGTARVTPAVRKCFAAMLLRLAASELLLLLLLLLRHAAILNFNHAFTSLRRRKAPILKTIRADFASL